MLSAVIVPVNRSEPGDLIRQAKAWPCLGLLDAMFILGFSFSGFGCYRSITSRDSVVAPRTLQLIPVRWAVYREGFGASIVDHSGR